MKTQSDILQAAEQVFSDFGYEGASMRQIAEAAGVAQALLHYHFKTKERLYEAVFEGRSQAAIGHRGKMLDALLASNPNPTLEEVLAVLFLSPWSAPRADRERLARYVQMVASLGIASDERSKLIVTKYFDPIAYRFVDVFMRAVPGLDRTTAVYCYLFAIGARMQAHASNGRAARLVGVAQKDLGDPMDVLVRFTAGGIRALAPKGH